jgi:hypothetical protein
MLYLIEFFGKFLSLMPWMEVKVLIDVIIVMIIIIITITIFLLFDGILKTFKRNYAQNAAKILTI